MRDELLALEVLGTLLDAQMLVSDWRIEYNTVRFHSALGCPTIPPPTPKPGGPNNPKPHSGWTYSRGPVMNDDSGDGRLLLPECPKVRDRWPEKKGDDPVENAGTFSISKRTVFLLGGILLIVIVGLGAFAIGSATSSSTSAKAHSYPAASTTVSPTPGAGTVSTTVVPSTITPGPAPTSGPTAENACAALQTYLNDGGGAGGLGSFLAQNSPPGVILYGETRDGRLLLGANGNYYTDTDTGPLNPLISSDSQLLLSLVAGQHTSTVTLSTHDALKCAPT